ncbi:pyridoxamine 5'-phosphate oxidase family protein [Noviluteimonas lactosilytica]|uniref:pyridoxamine 5'-phosphate oxidase family protein n=1 Tax=Noviluteimonas lactosilytica TaxID=2888523 RepID=UPI003CCD31A6
MATRSEKTQRIAKLLEDIDICMFTTVGEAGYLVSRPLSTQAAEFDGERLWFFTSARSPKMREIARNPKVNVAYASKDRNVYASVTGDARINQDPARIDEFWSDAYKAYFPRGKNDPNVALVEVLVRTVEYWEGPGSWIGKSVAFVIARVTKREEIMAENKLIRVRKGAPKKRAAAKKAGAKKAATKTATRKTAARKTATRTAATKKSAAKSTRRPAAKKARR